MTGGRAAVLLAVVAVVVVTLLTREREVPGRMEPASAFDKPGPSKPPAPVSNPARAVVAPPHESEPAADDDRGARVTDSGSREAVPVPDFAGRLVSDAGRAVVDAVVSWTLIPVGLRDPGSSRVALTRLASSTALVVSSDGAGRFELSDAPPQLRLEPVHDLDYASAA